jgi:hypothetical protein
MTVSNRVPLVWMLALTAVIQVAAGAAPGPAATPKAALPFDRRCPVFHDNGPVIEAVTADQGIVTAEFWRAMHALRDSLPKAPEGAGAAPGRGSGLRVSDNHRFLVTAEGKPFFWLADTAWQLIHDLDEAEMRRYFADRREKGFTVVQTVVLAEHRFERPNAFGHLPIEPRRPDRPLVKDGPNNDYWDLGNEHDFHREVPKWCDWLGPLVRQWDPYDHLLSAHNKVYRTPGKTWNDLQLIQRWDAGQSAFMLGERAKQAATGRAIPQVNEEYGYEDLWEKSPGQRAAETRRRLAWEISMAGCYQTTGETANRGTGFPPDTGGGWVNGRGDDSMTMLAGYAHMVDFFTSFDWWRGEPRNNLVRGGAFCLSEPGKWYAVYLPRPASITLALEPGNYHARWFHPRTGRWLDAPVASGPTWMPPATPDDGDWALLLRHDLDLVDTTPPSPVTAVGDLHRGEVRVTFSKPLDPKSVRPEKFTLEPGVKVLAAGPGDAPNTVWLSTGVLADGTAYTLTVRDVQDRSPVPNRLVSPARIGFQVYDATQTPAEVKFYFGTLDQSATLDATVAYDRGPVGEDIGPLAVGHFNSRTRNAGYADRMFRGLIDEIRVFGSVMDASATLDLAQIRVLQGIGSQASPQLEQPSSPARHLPLRPAVGSVSPVVSATRKETGKQSRSTRHQTGRPS